MFKQKSIKDCNKSSIWTNSDSTEEFSCGVRVKFSYGGSAAGYLYPVIILVSGLSNSEIPNNDFIVTHVEGLTINGSIGPRNKELGYVCFMRYGVRQIHFFDWFFKNIT